MLLFLPKKWLKNHACIILCNGKSPVRLFYKSPSLFPIWHGYDIIFKELAQKTRETDNFVSGHASSTSYSAVSTMQTVLCFTLKMKMLSVNSYDQHLLSRTVWTRDVHFVMTHLSKQLMLKSIILAKKTNLFFPESQIKKN